MVSTGRLICEVVESILVILWRFIYRKISR